eukprot:1143203-Pelagomonas_calceolata.AAC.4
MTGAPTKGTLRARYGQLWESPGLPGCEGVGVERVRVELNGTQLRPARVYLLGKGRFRMVVALWIHS